MNEHLDILDKIQRVDAPPFLYTRITQRIESEKFEKISYKKVWAIASVFLVILSVNIAIVVNNPSESNAKTEFAQSMNLISNNTLYK